MYACHTAVDQPAYTQRPRGNLVAAHDNPRPLSFGNCPRLSRAGPLAQRRYEPVCDAGLTPAGLHQPPSRSGSARRTRTLLRRPGRMPGSGSPALQRCTSSCTGVQTNSIGLAHLAGPKTIHFWAPTFKWGISLANIADFQRPADQVRWLYSHA